MRIEALTLERYGSYESHRLELDGPGLIVIYGPNEAGKSTCLAAIGDFLFGIPHNSARGGLYGYESMRIGMELRLDDGRRLALRRRKGRTRTLTDAAGAPVDEAVLAAPLGATTRERFEQLFGLDHASLRSGGTQLLAANGEIGRLIVEAGGGLRSLMTRLEAIDREADQLFAPRKSAERAFYRAAELFDQASRVVKAGQLSWELHEQARRAHRDAEDGLSQARAEKLERMASISGLERLLRILPILREKERVDAALSGFADLGALGTGFDQRWADAVRTRDAAVSALHAATSQYEEITKRLDGLSVDERLLADAPALRRIADNLILVAKARQDRGNRLAEIAEGEEQLAELRRRLGVGAAEDLAPRLPSAEALERLQGLALAAIERRAALDAAREKVAALIDQRAPLEARLATARSDGRSEPFGIAPASLAGVAGQAASLIVRQCQAEAALEGVAHETAALGFSSVAALRALPCPSPVRIAAELAALDASRTARIRHSDAGLTARGAQQAALAEMAALREGAPVATEAALHEARQARDAAWSPIREAHLLGRPDLPPPQRQAQIDALEHHIEAADRLSDRRISEAQRVASLVAAERRAVEAERAITAAAAAMAALDQVDATRRAALVQGFPDAVDRYPELAGLEAFVSRRRELLDRADQAAEAQREAERGNGELAPNLALLSLAEEKAGLSPASTATLAARSQAVSRAIMAHEQAHVDFRRETQELQQLDLALARDRRLLEGLEAAEAAWRTAWDLSLDAVGMTLQSTPEAANDLASRWVAARGVIAALGQTRRRLGRMTEDEQALGEVCRALGDKLALALPDDAVAAAGLLGERWKRNEEARSRRDVLLPELGAAKARRDSEAAELDRRETVLRALAREAGTPEDDAELLARAAERFAERTALRARQAGLGDSIHAAGDGLDEAALRAESQNRSVDALRAALADAQDRVRSLDQAIEAGIGALEQARLALAAQEDAAGINRAMAEREGATAQMHAAVERYVELKLARELMMAAIQQVRGAQQDPLVRRAGELFQLTTRGEFRGVGTDVNDRGEPVVVGLRGNVSLGNGASPDDAGGAVPVAALSDGTRDQLFLSFRLASLEAYCRAAEPLPFVADDILVHFDDARGAATLDLLADFCRTTQVLLFTHHRSVRDAAERLVSQGSARIVDLDAAPIAV